MNDISLVDIEKITLIEIDTSTRVFDKQIYKRRRKPKLWFGLIAILIILLIGYYVVNTLIEPKSETISIDETKLNNLVDKIVKGVPLTEIEWNELCELLNKVKNINVNGCDSCHDYLIALLGGKHYKWMYEYLNKPEREIKKGIKSIEKQIIEHQDKILNPEKHYSNWDNVKPLQKEDLINNKWIKDIQRQKEQKQILECILKNRTK